MGDGTLTRTMNPKRPIPNRFPLSLPCPPLQVSEPLSVDDGTLTRTMKPRRPAIAKRHAAELESLLAQLRG